MERGRALMGRIRPFLPLDGDDEVEDDLLGVSADCCSLSPLQRLYGFAACLLSGFACMFLSLILFSKPIKFALLFTFGNVFAVGSTAFLIGPSEQMRMMTDRVRIYATAIYVASVVLSLICVLVIHSKILTLIAIISEICALTWYSLSYVPFARRIVSELIISCCDTEI